MSEPIISVERVGKRYSLSHQGERQRYVTLRDVIAQKLAAPFRAMKGKVQESGIKNHDSDPRSAVLRTEDFWALRDVSFDIKRGDVVGIIGRNGAGKSTLLKILSRITEPTEGRVRINGRVASLLEVGTGFHPELTGRENVFLNGAILGMHRSEIKMKFDEIVAFAEVEKFLDTPVKRYSSGMYVRLAFAVAAHLEPEILIVDEVLAVGDAQFQKKCLGKMQSVATKEGRTVLFVSHNMAAVRTLCVTAMLFEGGKLRLHGDPDTAINQNLAQEGAASSDRRWGKHDAPGDELLRLRRVTVRGVCEERNFFPLEEDLFLDIEYEMLQPHPLVCVSIHLYTEGVCAFVGGNESSPHDPGIFRASCRIPQNLLNNNLYYVTVFLITNTTEQRVVERDVLSFSVEESAARGEYVGRVMGLVRPRLEWNTVKVESRFDEVTL
jgi:lipopolysaccharide transport system ATP-binding protein